MSILPKLIGIYERDGYKVMTGYNPYHFNGWMDAPFTVFHRGDTLYGCPGLALQEVMTLEGAAKFISPKNVLVIGNGFGWSTIALSMMFPSAQVLSIDPMEPGNEVTNRLATKHGLRITAALGESPRDVSSLCAEHLSGPCDFVLVDGIHTNDALLADFRACRPQTHDGTVWFFHDVINWRMVEAFHKIKDESGLSGAILTRTPSGMAAAWKAAPKEFEEYVHAFVDPPNLFRAYRDFAVDKMLQSVTAAIAKL